MKKVTKRTFALQGGISRRHSNDQVQANLPKGNNHANPLRILEPNRKRLTSLKAERVFRVSEENIKSVQIVLILPEVIKSLERFNIVFGHELSGMLREHDILRQKYENNVEFLEQGKKLEKEYSDWLEMKERQGDLFSESSSDTKSESSQLEEEFVIRVHGQSMETLSQNVVMAANELTYSVRNILRKFRSDPTAMKAVLGRSVKDYKNIAVIVSERLMLTE